FRLVIGPSPQPVVTAAGYAAESAFLPWLHSTPLQIQRGRASKGSRKRPKGAAIDRLRRNDHSFRDVGPLHGKRPRSILEVKPEFPQVSRLENQVLAAPLGQTISRLREGILWNHGRKVHLLRVAAHLSHAVSGRVLPGR